MSFRSCWIRFTVAATFAATGCSAHQSPNGTTDGAPGGDGASGDGAPPIDAPSQPALDPSNFYRTTLTGHGTVDPNTTSYMYAPAFVYDSGVYHYFACVGVSGDYVRHKSSSTLGGLAGAGMTTMVSPSPGETHNCDPAVIKGQDGRWYLHYSNTPNYTDAGVAVSNNIAGPYTKITTNLLGMYSSLSPGQYGRGQTTVTLGPDNLYYMAFTNQIQPLEPMGIVILKSADPSFSSTRTEVTRFDASLISGWSTQLSYDPQSGYFVFIEGNGTGFIVTSFDTNWHKITQEQLPLPAGAGVPGEGQAFLTDGFGRILHDSPDAHGSLVTAGATNGPPRNGFPTSITGANQWRTFRVNPVGVVDTIVGQSAAVRVAGWSFDPEDLSIPLQTHVYIGGVGTNLGVTTTPRPDVNAAKGTTGVHGFTAVIPTDQRGNVQVCIAAINIGAGDNEWINCQTVTVTD